MPQIINLSPIGDVQPGDAIPVFDESNGDARRMSVGQLSTYMEATLSLPDNAADIDYDPAGTGAVQRTVQGKLRDVVSVKDFGAVGDGVTDDTAAVQACFTAYPSNAEIDLCGGTYKITAALSLSNTTNVTLKNGALLQVTEAEDVLKCVGSYHSRLTLQNINLQHSFNTLASGSCFHVTASVTNFNFFRWLGGLAVQGRHGVKTNGGTWMMHFERVWSQAPYQSGWYLPASGSVVTNVALGGSTTTKLYKCFVSDVQTELPAYSIGTGYDTVILEHCSADRCFSFGYFKASPLFIINCSAEDSCNPPLGNTNTTHRFITLNSGAGQKVDGFHVTFNAGFVVPTPAAGEVNSFVYSEASGNLEYAGIRGGLPSGYYDLDVSYGRTLFNSLIIGQGIRGTFGAEIVDLSSGIKFTSATVSGDIVQGSAAQNTRHYTSGSIQYIGAEGTNANVNIALKSKGYGAVLLEGSPYMVGAYTQVVGGTNRDLYVDNTGAVGYVSSVRESKTNIADLGNVSWLLGLSPKTFNRLKPSPENGGYTGDAYSEKEYGLIAEEVETVNQELCFYDEVEGKKILRGIHYSKLIVPLLQLVQNQQAEIERIKAQYGQTNG